MAARDHGEIREGSLWLRHLPNLLSGLRLALVPVLLAIAFSGRERLYLALLLVALLTDALDGRIARRLGATSEFGARLDSWADLALYLSLPLALAWLRPDIIRDELPFLGLALAFYLAPIPLAYWKYRRLTSYHTYAAKLTAVVAGLAALAIFAGASGWLIRALLPLIALATCEEMAMTLILPRWHADVPSIFHALRLRNRE